MSRPGGKLRMAPWVLLSALMAAGPARAADVDPQSLMQGFPPPPEAIVTAANWRTPPYQVWSFRHLEQVRPTRTVFRGEGPVVPLEAADEGARNRLELAMSSGALDLDAFFRDNHVDGLILLKGGKVVLERYGNGQQPRDRHIMMSVGKSVVGTVAELLIHDGVLDENKYVRDYVPELQAGAFGDATVRQVMDMLVSVDYDETLDDPRSDVNQFLYAAGLGQPPAGVVAAPSLYAFLKTLGKKDEHGQFFDYVTPTSEVLGWIVARAAGANWADVFEERIYRALGAERDAFVLVDDEGTQTAAGGLALTLRDAARFAQMISDDGMFGGRRVLPAEVVARIKAGGDSRRWREGLWGWTGKYSYGSQWYVQHDAAILSALGIHGQSVHIGLDNDVVVVLQGSWPVAGGPGYWDRRAAFVAAAISALE